MPLTRSDLSRFTGTACYHLHPSGLLVVTDGVKYLAEKGEAFWLLDAIASYQTDHRITRSPMLWHIQFWKLTVNNGRGVLICAEDSGREPVIRQVIETTDFPLGEVEIWVERGGIPIPEGWIDALVAMLPNER